MIPILAYHMVSDNFDLSVARTSTRQFLQQMSWLSKWGYETISLIDYYRARRNKKDAAYYSNKIILTFDDCYDSIDEAASIMDRFGFTATCFIISNFIGEFNNWDYQLFFRKIKHADIDCLKKLHLKGWEIGSHSCNHYPLTKLKTNILQNELVKSKDALSALFNSEINCISYPFGLADQRVCKQAHKSGYTVGVGLGNGLPARGGLVDMCLPRLGVYLFDTLRSFERKVKSFGDIDTHEFKVQKFISSFSAGTLALKKWRLP